MQESLENDVLRKATRRRFLGLVAAGSLAQMALACAPEAAPAPSGTSADSEPARTGASWEAEWEQLIAAARTEGRVAVMGSSGTPFDPFVAQFERRFPGVTLELSTAGSVSIYEPKIKAEREAGIYSFDVGVIPPGSAMRALKPMGALDPIRPLIFHPEALDDRAWLNGFDWGFMDTEGQYAFAYQYDVIHSVAVNSDMVKDGEIKAPLDLLDPKWKSKIIAADVRIGGTFLAMTSMRLKYGEDAVKRFIIDQQPSFSRDTRLITEAIVRGRYPVALYAPIGELKLFRDEGIGKNVKYLDLPEIDSVPTYAVQVFNKAPHPNAAKLFINWFLTREGQDLWAKASEQNSRRTDVPPSNPEAVPSPGRSYTELGRESVSPEIVKTQKLLIDLVQQRGG